MLQKKVFQMWEIVEELRKEHTYLPERLIRDKVRDFVRAQVESRALVQVEKDPPVFAVRRYEKEWQNYLRLRRCPVCGSPFLPAQSTQELCSPECKREHYKDYHRKRREKLGMELDSRRRWTPEEVEKAIALKEEGKSYREIAQLLGRTPEGVKDKIKRFKKELRR